MENTITIQIHHDRLEQSNPYPAPIESALTEIKAKGLKERGWDTTGDPGIIRHETGAEIIVLASALVELTSAILNLVRESKSHRPETRITINVGDSADLSRILSALSNSPSH